MRVHRKLSMTCLLAASTLLLCSCGGSGKGLIPSASAGPLRQDFEAVAAAAKKGDGNCAPTHKAIAKMEHDYAELPRSIDVGLHERLSEGVENLTAKALSLCEQPSVSTTATQTVETAPSTPTSTITTTSTATSITESEEEVSSTISSETETLSSSSSGGGTEAPTEEPVESESESGGTEVTPPGVGPGGEGPPGQQRGGGVGAP